MPDDARRALLTRFFDHAPTFPPASLPPAEALAEDRRARESEHAWMLGRLAWPAAAASPPARGGGRARPARGAARGGGERGGGGGGGGRAGGGRGAGGAQEWGRVPRRGRSGRGGGARP